MSDERHDAGVGLGRSQQEGRRDDERAAQTGDESEEGGPDQREASTAEKAVITLSIALTMLLFSYAAWQLVTPATTDAPQASVVGTEQLADGSVAVTVQLRNPKDLGLVSATVSSDCSSPPAEVQFTYVPASSSRTGILVCPPGTTDPSVSLSNWVSQ